MCLSCQGRLHGHRDLTCRTTQTLIFWGDADLASWFHIVSDRERQRWRSPRFPHLLRLVLLWWTHQISVPDTSPWCSGLFNSLTLWKSWSPGGAEMRESITWPALLIAVIYTPGHDPHPGNAGASTQSWCTESIGIWEPEQPHTRALKKGRSAAVPSMGSHTAECLHVLGGTFKEISVLSLPVPQAIWVEWRWLHTRVGVVSTPWKRQRVVVCIDWMWVGVTLIWKRGSQTFK